jgi:hypothetical protein
MAEDEEVYTTSASSSCTTKRGDSTYARALAKLVNRAVGGQSRGYYTFLAMVANAAVTYAGARSPRWRLFRKPAI